MASEQEFITAIEALGNDRRTSFAELINKVWGGKIVEVYIGDTAEDIKYDEASVKYAAVVIGRVITAFKECLVMDCVYIDQASKKMSFGNIVCLNERGIRTITEVDESGTLKDTFLSSRDGKIVKKLLAGDK